VPGEVIIECAFGRFLFEKKIYHLLVGI